MLTLAQQWAEQFTRTHADVSVQVSGGGSGTGLAALVNGTADLVTSSREINAHELREARARAQGDVIEHVVATDALSVYVNARNSVRRISAAQLSNVYRGRIVNWRALGGRDAPIVLYGRESSSGTYAYFKEHVLHDLDFAPETQTLAGAAAVMRSVHLDENAIGYGGIATADGVAALALENAQGEYIAPTLESVTTGRYPLSRSLFMYTLGEPSQSSAMFLSWATSPAGQRLVQSAGYYPLTLSAVKP